MGSDGRHLPGVEENQELRHESGASSSRWEVLREGGVVTEDRNCTQLSPQ